MDLVQVQDNQVVVSSRQVAEHFGKRHTEVLRAVAKHDADLKLTDAKKRWFYPSSYVDGKGEKRKEYIMNRDGFSLLVMSFNNTRDVLTWKIKYIEAFDEMERRLNEGSAQQLSPVEMIAAIAQNAVEQERRLKAVETLGNNTAAEVREIRSTFTQKDTLENDIKSLVNRMVKEGYSDNYADAYSRLYQELQNLTGARINQRWKNKSEEEKKKTSKLKMIMADKKLCAGMIAAYESLARKILNGENEAM
nr:MAG TPA: regulatory protein [Caudoviricetes sp.]